MRNSHPDLPDCPILAEKLVHLQKCERHDVRNLWRWYDMNKKLLDEATASSAMVQHLTRERFDEDADQTHLFR